jgi:hypothetical protein
VSATGIHYNKNLNFFSLGHGGYFSPQQYLLGSVPVSWRERRGAVAYDISASGGLQSIREDASPYYPTRPLAGQSYYPSHVTTGPNYNVAAHLEYQVSPHWYVEGFATANNARNYASQTIGFALKLFVERVPTTNLHPRAIPDWRGKRDASATSAADPWRPWNHGSAGVSQTSRLPRRERDRAADVLAGARGRYHSCCGKSWGTAR